MAIKTKNMFSVKCWGDFRANLGLTGPRGGRRWTRLVPQFDFSAVIVEIRALESHFVAIFHFEKSAGPCPMGPGV